MKHYLTRWVRIDGPQVELLTQETVWVRVDTKISILARILYNALTGLQQRDMME
jgi:hypothetical protein